MFFFLSPKKKWKIKNSFFSPRLCLFPARRRRRRISTSKNLLPLLNHIHVELREARDVARDDKEAGIVVVEAEVVRVGHAHRPWPLPLDGGKREVRHRHLRGDADGVQHDERRVTQPDERFGGFDPELLEGIEGVAEGLGATPGEE